MFPNLIRGIFNPCYNQSANLLLYVKFSYKGVEKTLIYDYKQIPKIILPDDVIWL